MDNKKDDECMGITYGLIFGMTMGIIFNNLLLWYCICISIGVLIDQNKKEKKEMKINERF